MMNISKKISLQQFWNKLDQNSVAHLNEHFDELAPYLLQFLINEISRGEKFVIDVYKDGLDKGSVVVYLETKKHLELRLKTNSSYHLVLTINDPPDQNFVYKHKLDSAETTQLPPRLKRLIEKVRELGRPMTFYRGL